MSRVVLPNQMTEPAPPANSHPNAKRRAALTSVLAALLVTLLKLAAGLFTGSLGLLSEAAHSGIDLVAAALTLISVQISDRPADEDHNYGHGKIESLSAFVETGLMLGSSVWILIEALRRILYHHHLALPLSVWPFAVLLFSIAVDFFRSRALRRVAAQTGSPALKADALHFGTDMFSSFAVLLGLTATLLGERLHIPRLELADPLAAILVSAIILRVTWRLGRETVDALLDATPAETRAQLRRDLVRDLSRIEGVIYVDRVRTRRAGSSFFADLTLGLPRNLTFQRSEQITKAATESVRRHLPGADVVVHSVPTASLAESVHDRIRAVAARANLAIHDVSVQQYGGELHVEQHLEVGETLHLRDAHDLVTRLEADIRRDLPAVTSILTHIESEPATIERPASLEGDRDLELRLRQAARAFPEVLDIHEVVVNKTGDRTRITCHCTLPDDLPMARVHAVITALENAFRLDAPEVAHLLIHPEPATDNCR